MADMDIRIVKLEPFRYASAYGFGTSPEGQAWERILGFAERRGYKLEDHRFFGFDNPPMAAGSPNYGYEQWVTVDRAAEPENGIRVGAAMGGTYAVAECEGVDNIFPAWQKLVVWAENNGHRMTSAQCLEECLNPQLNRQNPPDLQHLRFVLYLPISS